MNMKQWAADLIAADKKKSMPVLTFPAIQDMGITVKDLIYSVDYQTEAMKRIHDRTDMAATLAFMDLSVEAESFGSNIRYTDEEVPTVIGSIIDEDTDIDSIKIPDPTEGRCGVCIESVRNVAKLIDDRPVIAGNIGPFSLAGRLMDVNEVMYMCYDEPELVHAVLDKVTDFLVAYTKEFKAAGADGILMAEPLAGLLSPELTEEFSNPYVKRIVDECQDDEFLVIVHNCGSSVKQTIDTIVETGAAGFHFGNAVDMAEIMPHIPADVFAMGNVDPASQFRNGTPESVYNRTLEVLESCAQYPNFIISSGCDIPPVSPWENIDAFFKAVDDFYAEETEVASVPAEKHVPKMTARERFYATLNHEPVDRVATNPFIAGANRILAGCDHVTWVRDMDKCAKGYLEMGKLMPEMDFYLAAIDFTSEATAWGQKVIYTGNNPGKPDFSDMVIKGIDDYAKVETLDASEAERMQLLVSLCEKLVAGRDGDKPVIAYVMGPLSVLSMMRGQKKIDKDLRSNPEAVKAAVQKVTATLKQQAELLMATGIDGIMWDVYYAAASHTGKDTWKNVEFDAMAELAETVRAKGGVNFAHSCGNGVFMDLLIESMKVDCISFFHEAADCETMADVKAKYGDKTALMGAVTPWDSVFGTDLEWDLQCFEAIDTFAEGSGFFLAPGCFYPANASLGRASRMMHIATDYGVR